MRVLAAAAHAALLRCSPAAPIVTSSRPSSSVEADVDPLVLRGRDVLADVVGADRQLAVAAVDQRRELHARGPAEVEDRVDRGAHGAARVEDVVDDHDRAVLEREVELGREHDRRARADREVVAVEGDVERAERDGRCAAARRRARAGAARGSRRGGGCRRARPVRATRLGPLPGGFFSTISCAIRTSVRRMSSGRG